jgi:hypothetical protein
VNPDEVGKDDIVTALLTPSASYKIIQVMPNGILDCENLTTGDRLGLRPGAVSLVQKAEKSQEPGQQALDLEPKPDAPTKYARVKLKGDRFDGQVFAVVKGNELGSTLATPDGHHWFRRLLRIHRPRRPNHNRKLQGTLQADEAALGEGRHQPIRFDCRYEGESTTGA